MKYAFSTLAAVAALVPSISAHYCFNRLIVDGNYTSEYEYVRKNTNSNSPVTDVTSNDLRCNVGGLASGSTTKTHEVQAGSEVGFALDTAIGHPGPLQVYMSKADSTAAEYDGSGDWFKVYEMGPKEITSDGLQWASNQIQNFTFTLAPETPDGEYLLRVEHVGLHGASTFEGAQFYISCAQIKVTGGSSASPSPTVKIPGVYTGKEPGLMINIYYPIPTNYTMPGPAVWPEGADDASGAIPSAGASSAATSATSVAAAAAAVVSTPAAVPTPAAPTPVGPVGTPVNTPPAVGTPVGTPLFTPPVGGSTPVATPGSSSGTLKKYAQCGGSNFKGSGSCESGTTCKAWNDFYSQCV